jgi:mRNA interferase RelE/StbE
VNSNYNIRFTKQASRALGKLDKTTAKRIIQAIESLSYDPYHHSQTKKMKGYEGHFFRLRVGNFRIIYEVIDNRLLIVVVKIGSRGDVYK